MMNISEISVLLTKDISELDKVFFEQFKSTEKNINDMGKYICKRKGKRIRPIVTLLAARAVESHKTNNQIQLASVIELIHTASLLHDDVIDRSKIRRGRLATHMVFGNTSAILIGDFIYTRAFKVMLRLKSMKIFSILAETVNVLVEGEMLQMQHNKNINLKKEEYDQIIYQKTARLFESATYCAGMISKCDCHQEKGLKKYGKHLGLSFQIIDDLLDYKIKRSNSPGNDLSQGKVTLPLMHTINSCNTDELKIIRKAIVSEGTTLSVKDVLNIMNKYGSLQWGLEEARKEAKKAVIALNNIPDSIWRDALVSLLQINIERFSESN